MEGGNEMTDMNVLRERAKNIIHLAEKMDDVFDRENHEEHLILAIMAGLEDACQTGFNQGYVSRPA